MDLLRLLVSVILVLSTRRAVTLMLIYDLGSAGEFWLTRMLVTLMTLKVFFRLVPQVPLSDQASHLDLSLLDPGN